MIGGLISFPGYISLILYLSFTELKILFLF